MVLAHEPRPPRRARSSYIRQRAIGSIYTANVPGLIKGAVAALPDDVDRK